MVIKNNEHHPEAGETLGWLLLGFSNGKTIIVHLF